MAAAPNSLVPAVAYFVGFPHPFRMHERITAELPAGWTVADAVRESKLASAAGFAGTLVRVNGRTVSPIDYSTTVLAAGDRVVARRLPKDPISIMIAIGSAIASIAEAVAASAFVQGIISGIGGALGGTGLGSAGLGGALSAGNFALAAGYVVGYTATYLGAGYLVSLATKALIGSPSGGKADTGATKRTSPTASGAGNQLLPDHPVFIPVGDVRVHPPHVAVPFQPGVNGGQDQDPSLRELLGVAGDVILTEGKLGKIPLEMLDIDYTVFQNQTTVSFPTASVKRPGITLRDQWFADPTSETDNPYEVVSTDVECDELGLVWFLAGGLNRTSEKGIQKQWQLTFDIQYRVAGAGGWSGFFQVDGSGNTASFRTAPFVRALQIRGDNKWHLTGVTAEPFFFYCQRRVTRARYEVRFRLLREAYYLKADGTDQRGDSIPKGHWTRDRYYPPPGTGDSDTVGLATDPQLVQFAAFRDEPAVEGFTPGLSCVDLQLLDQTTKSDESSRISFRAQQQIPNLSGGARTAATTTRNPVAICLWIMTGPMTGDNPTPDTQIDFPSWQAAWDYCDAMVPTIGGGTEKRHECDAVLDRDGVSRAEQVAEILSNFRMRLFRMDGKYHIAIDRKRTAPVDLFSEAEILEFDSDRSWTVIPDVLRVEFWNRDKDGKDEIHVYNDSPPVTGILEHGGYAEKTAEVGTALAPVSVTCAHSGDYSTLTRASGVWTFADLPEEGWVCIRFPGGTPFADARLFLIDDISADFLTITVVDKAGAITAGTRNARFNTTAAQRVEALTLPYSQRPSECFREARYFLAQRNRPETYNIHVGTLDWLRVYIGAMFEASCSVCQFGRGAGRALAIEGTLASCTAVQMDEEFDLTGISDPVIKFVTSDGAQRFVTRIDVNAMNTSTKRSATSDDRWISFDSAQNLSTIGFKHGGGNGSVGAFGEKFYETKELVVQGIRMGNDLSGTLRCVDHAPEIFDAILDQAPVPRFNSGISEPGIGDRARPAMPQVSAMVDGISTPMQTIGASALNTPSSGQQEFTRAAGSYITDGWTQTHKVTTEGYGGTPANNKTRATQAAAPSATKLTLTTAVGGSEAGTGDERIRGVIGTAVTTLSVRRAATGVAKLDVTQNGGGVVYLDGPNGALLFADFLATGIVELSDMKDAANNGFFVATALRNGGDGIQLSSTTMVTSTGRGAERCHQANFVRTSGSFTSDGIAALDRVAPDGFAQDIAPACFTVRMATALVLAVDDPFGLLVTEAGSGDETLTRVKVPIAYEVDAGVASGALQLQVTVPIRPGTKGIVPTEEIEARYRLRDRATGRISGGWVSEGSFPASSIAVTFGPIPADSDFDVACRAISREKKTSSDWMVLTGNGPSDRPPAPTHLQIHSDSIASEEGRRFALRAEWTAPDTTTVRSYLLRYQREGDGAWQHVVVHEATSTVISDARIGTYNFELYTLAANGQPSDAVLETFDWQPDRDFENTTVLNLRLVNHADDPSVPGMDPLLEFKGPDILIAATEPDFTGEYTGSETADVNTGLDPLVRDFDIEVFDPATGTQLRLERGWRAREYRYTRSMNADDQIRVFSRWAQREVGFRWRMNSVTNRVSAWDVLAVANPKPVLPGSLTLTSTPGNSTQSLPAIVHADFQAGGSSDDSDVADYAVWASETPGFTPGPSNFKGVSGRNGSRVSFPASSGVTIYVRAGRLDEFHGSPELIALPETDVSLLSEQSVATIDGAVFPVDTGDIVKKAVTDAYSGHQDVSIELGGNGDQAFRTVLSLNALPSGGIVAVKADALLSRGSNQIEGTVRLLRDSRISVVKLWDDSAGQFLDFTQQAYNDVSGDVTLFGDTSDILYLGSPFPMGRPTGTGIEASFPHVQVVITSGAGGNAAMTKQYWNGSTWATLSDVEDETGGFALSGAMQWDTPTNAALTDVDGDSLYWVRFQRTLSPNPGATAARIYLRQIMNEFTVSPAGSQEYLPIPLAYTIDPTEGFEGVILEANSTAGGSNRQGVETSTMQLSVGKR